MSYSLSPAPQGRDFAAARSAADAAYEAMVKFQPLHAKDKDAAFAALDAAAAKVTFNPDMDVVIYMNGSASWDGAKFDHDSPNIEFTGVNVGIGIHQLVRREPEDHV